MTELPEMHGDNLNARKMNISLAEYNLELDAPAGVWNPTPHGIHLGHVLATLDFTGKHVLELGTGCGIHAILIARRNASRITMTEIDEEILDSARRNLKKHEVTIPLEFQVADWTNVKDGPFDTVVANPPFAKSGKRYRRYFIDTLILHAHNLLRPGGSLIFVQSSMADIPRSIRLLEECGMEVMLRGETSGPFREYYFEDPSFMREIAAVPGAYEIREGRYYERLMVFEAVLP